MTDQILQLGISLIAILFIALLARYFWPQSWTLDVERVRRAIARSDYGFSPEKIWIDQSAKAAITLTDLDQTLGYAFVFGDRVTCRPLSAGDIESSHMQNNTLTLHFTDYTLNHRDFIFSDTATCQEAYQAVNRLVEAKESVNG